jgi:hypothetical protein
MKYLLVTILLLITIGCGSPGSSVGNQPQTTSLAGNWTINAASPEGYSVIIAQTVSSPCTVIQNGEKLWVTETVCVAANNFANINAVVEMGGSFIYPPQGVLIGSAANPVATGGSVSFVFVEADQYGDFAGFSGTGSVTLNGHISGTFNCTAGTPVCFGDSGTFTAVQN